MLQKSMMTSPGSSMKGLTASLTGSFFQMLLRIELPNMDEGEVKSSSPLQTGQMAAFLLRFITDINFKDPKSLLASEMPGMERDHSVLLRPGSNEPEAPEDYNSIALDIPNSPPQAAQTPTPEEEISTPSQPPENEPDNVQEHPTTDGRKVVFIYHSHNRESYYPELKSSAKDPNSSKVNVTLVGKRLAKQLEKLGIGSSQSTKDYPSTIKGYNWNNSYKYSLQTVKEAMASNKQLTYFFDIHRDSQKRNKTTATINGKDYAQVYFIIGHKNSNWRKNEAYANSLHERLEKDYPGLSRGVWGKTAANGNGEYNQSVAENSVLIEIGGVDNSLEECYRTVDLLANAIAEQYWDEQDAIKVNLNS